MKLYHYVHCPFCVRVRMALGYLDLSYESIVLAYDDEATPYQLMGIKMLPIFVNNENSSNESLDIIKTLDIKNKLDSTKVLSDLTEVEDLITRIGKDVHSLAMPYWMWTPEFNETSRSYFQNKKEVKRGPFSKLVKKQSLFITNLNSTLEKLEERITIFYKSDKLTLNDIIIASHLWGMYIVPEFQFSTIINAYLQRVARKCNFNYHEDFWR